MNVRGEPVTRAAMGPVRAVLRMVVLMIALLAPCSRSLGDLPGTIRLSAAGEGHLWWVVKAAPEPDARSRAASVADSDGGFALLHHAADAPAPTERLVSRFAEEPAAIAAEGQRVVLFTRGDRPGAYFVVSMFAAKNETVGHWYTLPRGAPMVLDAPPVHGDIRAVAIAGDALGLLLRLERTDPGLPERYWFGTIPCESGADAVWTERPLPPLDLAEPVRLFARSGGFAAVGAAADGAAVLASFEDSRWSVESLRRGSSAGAGSADRMDPRGVIGAFALAGRPVVVERVPAKQQEPVGGAGHAGDPTAAPNRIRLGFVRAGALQPWADFAEPVRPWSVGPFHAEGATIRAALLEIGERGRGVARALPLSASEPEPVVELAPPGFASGSWIHLPIVGVLSVALVLGAVIFGSDAYLDSRLAAAGVATAVARVHRRTARGARLGRRALAMLIDLLPGLVGVWLVVRGSPLELLQIPAFQTNLVAAVPSLVVFGAGWLVATVGDVAAGRSLGKRLVGLRIVAARGGPASPGRRLVRSVASLVTVANPVVMLLVLLHPKGDGPAEMLSGTAVVDAAEADADEAASANGDGPSQGR